LIRVEKEEKNERGNRRRVYPSFFFFFNAGKKKGVKIFVYWIVLHYFQTRANSLETYKIVGEKFEL